MPSSLLRHDNLAVRLGQATASAHVLVTITPRSTGLVALWRSLTRGFLWEREWAGVIK